MIKKYIFTLLILFSPLFAIEKPFLIEVRPRLIDGAKVIDLLKKNIVGINSYELSLELSFKERNPIDYKLKNDVKDSVDYWKKIIK